MSNPTVENVYTRQTAKELAKKHFWKLLGMMLTVAAITYAVMFGCAALAGALGTASGSEGLALVLSLIAVLAAFLVASGLSLGLISAMLYICRGGEQPRVSQVFSRMGKSLKAFGLTLWIGLKTMLWALPGYVLIGVAAFFLAASTSTNTAAGSSANAAFALLPFLAMFVIFALVIPAVYRYMLSTYILADNPETGVFECVRQSKAMMKGHKWQAFKLVVPLVLLLYLGVFLVALVFGLLVALLGENALSLIASIVLLVAWVILILYFSIRVSLGYCVFYLKRCREQQTPADETAPDSAE